MEKKGLILGWHQRYLLDDTEDTIHENEIKPLICALSDEMPRFSFLGNYKES